MMLLWLLNLDFAGGFAAVAPTEFIALPSEPNVVVSCAANVIITDEPNVTIPGTGNTGV